DSPPNYPDGLTQALIDALVAEVDAAVHPVRRVPPLFADRDAVLRRERRRANRALARAARLLPPVVLAVADGVEAA
ncbi:MAG: hypothetical protein ACRDRU_23340, partial [Pseudonocardiaceae bacterium]